MYRYAATRNRVHRVIVEGGKAFKVEQCNLDDAAFLHLDDVEPAGTHCAYCWAGWVPPTPEQQEAREQEVEAFKNAPEARAVPIVQATRRMALAALAGAALLGGAAGVLASGDPAAAVAQFDPELARQVGQLQGQVQVLQLQLEHLAGELPAALPQPVTVVIPTLPAATSAPAPAPTPTPSTAPDPPTASPVAQHSSSTTRRASSSTTTRTTTTRTTVVVVPAPTPAPGPTPAPTPAPTPRPCRHPGLHRGLLDPCWPRR